MPCLNNQVTTTSNQAACQSCDYGMVANEGHTQCLPCSNGNVSHFEYCVEFLNNEQTEHVHTTLSIVLPIVFGLLFILGCYLAWRWWQRRKRIQLNGGDENDEDNWLLSYSKLTHPSMQYVMLDQPTLEKSVSSRTYSSANVLDFQGTGFESMKDTIPHWALCDAKHQPSQSDATKSSL